MYLVLIPWGHTHIFVLACSQHGWVQILRCDLPFVDHGSKVNSIFKIFAVLSRASLVAQTVRNLPEMRETQVRTLSHEDPLEKEMATHSSILTWRIPWTENLAGYIPWDRKQSDTTEQVVHTHTYMVFIHCLVQIWVEICFLVQLPVFGFLGRIISTCRLG